ncbi:MAG TPA: YjbH domain-containing protein [Longimicrobiaceae bacterium]|nr:YjbH domain-containing protein [Longimicrobiaceae bacterium]
MRVPCHALLLALLLSGSLAGGAAPLRAQTAPAASPLPRDTSSAAVLTARITRTLVRHGFSDVAAVVQGARVYVAFENTRYRDDRRALGEAAALVLAEFDGARELVLVPTSRAVPFVAVRYAGATAPAEASLDLSPVPAALGAAPRAGSSSGRLDVVVHPWFEAVFGDYDDPVASRTGVAPELRVALRRGLGLSAQALVTVQDDVPTGESRVRPGLVALNRTVRLPRGVFVSATAGTFTPDRYGVDVEARAYFRNGRWSAGAQTALTGEVSYAREGWRRAPMDDPTALVDVAWRGARHDLLLRATGGAFLGRERGVRLDVVRQFGELEVGWFAMRTARGANGGATLRIPLLPARHAAPGPVRVRAADAFPWQYRYRGYLSGGRPYRTGYSLDELVRGLHPDHVVNGDR